MGIGAQSTSRGRRMRATLALALAGAAAAGTALVVSVALAAPSKTIVITDPADDVTGALDLTRVSLQRSADGRLRAVLTFADKLTPKALLASSGPPGSACLRIWTAENADPASTRPTRLVCVTGRSDDEFRGGVYELTGAGLPKRIADASIKRTASARSVVIRFTQTALGRPARIRFAAESTRPGCERVSCIDTAPDGAVARTFRLR